MNNCIGEKNLKSILFHENEREIQLKQETVAVHKKMKCYFLCNDDKY